MHSYQQYKLLNCGVGKFVYIISDEKKDAPKTRDMPVATRDILTEINDETDESSNFELHKDNGGGEFKFSGNGKYEPFRIFSPKFNRYLIASTKTHGSDYHIDASRTTQGTFKLVDGSETAEASTVSKINCVSQGRSWNMYASYDGKNNNVDGAKDINISEANYNDRNFFAFIPINESKPVVTPPLVATSTTILENESKIDIQPYVARIEALEDELKVEKSKNEAINQKCCTCSGGICGCAISLDCFTSCFDSCWSFFKKCWSASSSPSSNNAAVVPLPTSASAAQLKK